MNNTMNLPRHTVNLCLCDGRISEKMKKALEKLGISVLVTSPMIRLPAPLSCHPDMQIFDCENGSIIVAPRTDRSLLENLSDKGFTVITGCKEVSE